MSFEFLNFSNKNCQILIGKNETGKSNILKALSLFDSKNAFNYDDNCNKTARKTDSKISLTATSTHSSGIVLVRHFLKDLTPPIFPSEIISEIKLNRIERIVEIDSKNTRTDTVWFFTPDKKIFKDYIYKNETQCVDKIEVFYEGTEEITPDNIEELIGTGHSILTGQILGGILDTCLAEHITSFSPKVIFWESSPQYLINGPIDLNSFKDNPTSVSVPLNNIFQIAGVEDVKTRVELIALHSEERFQLQEELSKAVTTYINDKWIEHEINISIQIEKDLSCEVFIEDKDDSLPKYQMNQRSDGFKQFISILLNLSMGSAVGDIKDNLILLDEPEVHLHPSGTKYLRDELLKISEHNDVVVSTHSIYMVDKLNLERHFKVEKNESQTNIKQIKKDNPYEEEVIYEALGTSVYEHIHPNMIVFEGKTDKDIFDAFTKKFRTDLKPRGIGTISADGVDKIPPYPKFFDGKFVKGFVLVDSDKAGKGMKERVINDNKNFTKKNTFEINEILDTKMEATLEDLFPKDVLCAVIRKEYDSEVALSDDIPVIEQLKKHNAKSSTKLDIDKLKGLFVRKIIKSIQKPKKADVQENYKTYYMFLEKFHVLLKK